jgi:hypothetical protein
MRRLRALLSTAVLLALAGCSWSDVLLEEMRSLPPDASLAYNQGYAAGCRTAIAENGGIGFDRPRSARDDSRLEPPSQFSEGWQEGLSKCTQRYSGPILLRSRVIN